MPNRHRFNETFTLKGRRIFNGTVEVDNQYVRTHRHDTNDVTGPGDNLNFSSEKIEMVGGVINRPFFTPTAKVFQNYLADALWTEANWPWNTVAGSPTNTTAATIAAARSNPSRPYVDVPVALLELPDIVKLTRDSGRDLASKAGGANLKYQFGIAPLAGDIAKLIYFHDQVDRRVNEIKRLQSGRGLRRTVRRIFEGESSGTKTLFVQSNGISIQRTFQWAQKETVSGHCRWLPAVDFSRDMSSQRMSALAKRAVLGLTFDGSSAWELIPWSWLIDWCSNFGSFLAAQRNIIPAQLQNVSVMRHTQCVYVCPDFFGAFNAHMSGIVIRREKKTRQIASVLPEAHFPFLNGKQVGILASLYATRR